MAVPWSLGARLPGLRRPGVRRYIPSRPPAKPVRAAPASAVGTNGVSNVTPRAISALDKVRTKPGASHEARNGYVPFAMPCSRAARSSLT